MKISELININKLVATDNSQMEADMLSGKYSKSKKPTKIKPFGQKNSGHFGAFCSILLFLINMATCLRQKTCKKDR